jgi:hypothetical protein
MHGSSAKVLASRNLLNKEELKRTFLILKTHPTPPLITTCTKATIS